MELLIYNELHPKRNAEQFKHVCEMLEKDNFQQAEVKKLCPSSYYRAKLNDSDRLLFSFVEYRGVRYILLLEIIYNHEYAKSRFLNGAAIDESRISAVRKTDEVPPQDVQPLTYRNPGRKTFHLLDRPLSFDELQETLFSAKLPMILVGSAGSGKTVLSLEKVKTFPGDVLYVTRSAYLADNARRLYSSNGYDNPGQSVDFLSFEELTRSIRSPEGRQAEFADFLCWHRNQPRRNEFDVWQLYEEFFGVITGHEVKQAYLKLDDYQALGIKQSIFPAEKREAVYQMFQSWLAFMEKNHLYLETIRCYELLGQVRARYDFLIVDEVQDLTNIQLLLALRCLRNSHAFLLCGDSNQIVHPNFFSWSAVKSLFYKDVSALNNSQIRILHSNYRNSIAVTDTANQILRLKVRRFGSVDRESNFLVECTSEKPGLIKLLPDNGEIRKDLNDKTSGSVHFAVLVLRETDKNAARQVFKTPLVFSVRESKGLEYRNVILYNLVSANRSSFDVVTEGMNGSDLAGDLKYVRNKDKSDKSLEICKFFINSLYVAVTRAVENIYWVERECSLPIFHLLNLNIASGKLNLQTAASSADEWRREAVRLAAQGKKEQSARILSDVLKLTPVPWEVIDRGKFYDLVKKAVSADKFNSGSKQKLADYAFTYTFQYFFPRLVFSGYKAADNIEGISQHCIDTYLVPVNPYNRKNLRKKIERHGVDFRNELNQTPLMLAAKIGDDALIRELLELSADPSLTDNCGFTAFHYLLRMISFRPWDNAYYECLEKLAPEFTTVRVDGREIKIGRQKAEHILLHIFLERLRHNIGFKNDKITAVGTAELCGILEKMPNSLVPQYRKARTYCSAILSKNETDSTNPYGMKLFYRLRNGHYILNPELEFYCSGKWLFWDELLLLRFWNFPLFELQITAMALFLQDIRSHLKNASFNRSFILCYNLRFGFDGEIPVYKGYPPVGWEELMDYAKRIANLYPDLPPLPSNEDELKRTCCKQTHYLPPFIYPGVKPEEIPLRNFLRQSHEVCSTPEMFQDLLKVQLLRIREQAKRRQRASPRYDAEDHAQSDPENREQSHDRQEKQSDRQSYAVDEEYRSAMAAARERLEKEAREFQEARKKRREDERRQARELKEKEQQEKQRRKEEFDALTPDLFDLDDSGDRN